MPGPANRARYENGGQGDTVFEEFYDRYASDIYTYCLNMTRSEDLAEECLQQVFITMYKNPHFFTRARHLKSYLFKVVRNKTLQILSELKMSRALPENLEQLPSTSSAEITPDMERAQQALQELTQNQREVILLHLFENMNFREIAQITGESPNTLTYRYQSGIKKMKEKLGVS
ncbi:RNA polymerase sigma factor [Planctomycetota bacterium]